LNQGPIYTRRKILSTPRWRVIVISSAARNLSQNARCPRRPDSDRAVFARAFDLRVAPADDGFEDFVGVFAQARRRRSATERA
jgi:hypothetical protein